jgi:peptide/nickel transport system ATP-binding protein
MILLEVKNLVKHFKVGGGLLKKPLLNRAVDDVSFSIKEGETLGRIWVRENHLWKDDIKVV